MIKIGNKDYKVISIDGDVIVDSTVCFGAIDYHEETIKISSLYGKDMQNTTLLHECLHGIDDYLEIGLSEEQVRKLGKGLYTMIKDNSDKFDMKVF